MINKISVYRLVLVYLLAKDIRVGFSTCTVQSDVKPTSYTQMCVLSVFAGVFVLTAVIVFATLYPLLPDHATQDVHFHWSFGVDITAAILFFITPSLLIVDMRKSLLWIV